MQHIDKILFDSCSGGIRLFVSKSTSQGFQVCFNKVTGFFIVPDCISEVILQFIVRGGIQLQFCEILSQSALSTFL